MRSSYHSFANVYDTLMEDTPYDQWLSFSDYFIKKYFPKAKRIIDLGCGTGEISIRFQQKGFQVTGLDISSDMLSIASQKDINVQNPITWINQDIVKLETKDCYDVAVSYCDVMNYITQPDDLRSAFQRIYRSLNKNGLLLFDVHSEHYIKEFLADQTFGEVREHLSFIWFCEQGEQDSSVEHYLTFFVEKEKGLYERFDEYHVQKTYPISFYKKTLEQCGFIMLGIFSDFSTTILNELDDRIFFVCQKIE